MSKRFGIFVVQKTKLDPLKTRYSLLKSGLSQAQVAKRLKISDAQVSRLLDAKNTISPELLGALSAILGVDSSKLVKRERAHVS